MGVSHTASKAVLKKPGCEFGPQKWRSGARHCTVTPLLLEVRMSVSRIPSTFCTKASLPLGPFLAWPRPHLQPLSKTPPSTSLGCPKLSGKNAVASSSVPDTGRAPSVHSQPGLTRSLPSPQEKTQVPGLAFQVPGPAPYPAHHPRGFLTVPPCPHPLSSFWTQLKQPIGTAAPPSRGETTPLYVAPISTTSLESFLSFCSCESVPLHWGLQAEVVGVLLRHLSSTGSGTQQVLTHDDKINKFTHY